MSLDKKYIEHFVNVSSRAALASSYLVGKKDKIAADQAAVDAMRIELNKIDMNGTIVIGEGALDEAPLLFPNFSPVYKSGALSKAPSPITIVPFMSILLSSILIASTAA